MSGPMTARLEDIVRRFRVARPAGSPKPAEDPAQLPPLDELKLATAMLLESRMGEASLKAIAARALECYAALSPAQRLAYFHHLVDDVTADADAVRAAFAAWDGDGDESALAALFRAAESPRQQLFRRLNHAPGGTLAIIGLRRDLREVLRDEPRLRPLDDDLKHLLTSWFNRGFLRMRQLRANEDRALLDFLVEAEHVHPMADRAELKRRIAPKDRRVYAFFHPAVEVPLIFVEVALTKEISDRIEPLLEPGPALSPQDADTAVLYSINNALDGLAGISFGSSLIKQVTEEVGAELPGVRTFVTLSPMPGLRAWTERTPPESSRLRELLADAEGPEELHRALDGDADLRDEFTVHVARYLTEARGGDGRLADPVGRFHLGNGATVWQIDPTASSKPYAWRQSYGAMVNYRYCPELLEEQHEAFTTRGVVAVSPDLRQLLDER